MTQIHVFGTGSDFRHTAQRGSSQVEQLTHTHTVVGVSQVPEQVIVVGFLLCWHSAVSGQSFGSMTWLTK